MKPKGDWILIEKIEGRVTSLVIPAQYKYRSEDFHKGNVLEVGPKVTEVVKGDEVAYNKNLGVTVDTYDGSYFFIKPSYIFAVR